MPHFGQLKLKLAFSKFIYLPDRVTTLIWKGGLKYVLAETASIGQVNAICLFALFDKQIL